MGIISTGAQQDLRYPAPRFNEKGCLPVWGGDAVIQHKNAHGT